MKGYLATLSLALLLMGWSVSEAEGGKFSSLLKEMLSGKSWEECSKENEVCYSDYDCCDDYQCRETNNFRGPKYACKDIPSRSYRHLGAYPSPYMAEVLEPSKPSQGVECRSSNECKPGECCQKVVLFKGSSVQRCDEERFLSQCV